MIHDRLFFPTRVPRKVDQINIQNDSFCVVLSNGHLPADWVLSFVPTILMR